MGNQGSPITKVAHAEITLNIEMISHGDVMNLLSYTMLQSTVKPENYMRTI